MASKPKKKTETKRKSPKKTRPPKKKAPKKETPKKKVRTTRLKRVQAAQAAKAVKAALFDGEPEDIEETIASKKAEMQRAAEELEALQAEKTRAEEERLAAIKDTPTAFQVHGEQIKVSVDPPMCDMHVTIKIPSQDITFHEKIEIDKNTDTPAKRRELIRTYLNELIDKHRPPVYETNDGPDVVGVFSLKGEFEDIANELKEQRRDDLEQKAAALGLNPEDFGTKYDIALAIILKEWRPPP